ncbi:MAG: T9SS type A sorting domain-containing protein [Bacteroidales bacterium]|nr:T9SS type A sorting domain-containing protein [Bacteroidales bacterium]MBP9511498.1 T9SS type A sorting domain-containing protein [Bacteroidales bacterium]MBP9588226.1 T9SS type A sorting domain-containing protein [Bacteroidales bacterium]
MIVSIDDPIEHPEKTRLRVYPDPAKEKVTVEMPEYLIRKSEGNGISATTYYHQWPEVRMVVFNLFGRMIFSKEIQQSEKTVSINISTWPKGMYLVSIVFMNDIVGSGKFIVN